MRIKSTYISLLCALAFVTHGLGQVPSLINYQGRLADANGAPVTGSKNFTLSIYDGETEGSVLYSEDIGAVTLDDNGVYNFQFGESGTSQATATKSVGVADGIKNVFNTVLPDSAMGVSSIGDGTYTWTPTNGSSSPTSFIGSYDSTSRTVSAIYIGEVPLQGTAVTVSYTEQTEGIMGALAAGTQHWLELSIDGETQTQRERVLSVPFAQVAGSSGKKLVRRNILCSTGWWLDVGNDEGSFANIPVGVRWQRPALYYPKFGASVKSLEAITAKLQVGIDFGDPGPTDVCTLQLIRHEASSNEESILVEFVATGLNGSPVQILESNDSIPIDTESYSYYFYLKYEGGGSGGLSGLKLSVMNAE